MFQELRFAARALRKRPGFTLIVVITLALGIGANTAIFSVVNAVLLRPLAYQHPERMVWLTTQQQPRSGDRRDANANGGPEIMNSIDFSTWQAQSTSFAHMIAYDYSDATLVAGSEASRIRIVAASDGFWEVSGARPVLGTLPTSREPDVLALTHGVYREQFQSDPQIIGRAVTIDGRQMTIGAVLPEDFQPQLPGQQWWISASTRVDAAAYRLRAVEPPPRVIDQGSPAFRSITACLNSAKCCCFTSGADSAASPYIRADSGQSCFCSSNNAIAIHARRVASESGKACTRFPNC